MSNTRRRARFVAVCSILGENQRIRRTSIDRNHAGRPGDDSFSAFGLDLRVVRQPGVLGSADAVARAVEAGAAAPLLVVAADTVFRTGDVGRFRATFERSAAAGAIAVRREPPPGPGRLGVVARDGLVEQIGAESPLSGAPLWALGREVVELLRCDREPYELESSFREWNARVEQDGRIVPNIARV